MREEEGQTGGVIPSHTKVLSVMTYCDLDCEVKVNREFSGLLKHSFDGVIYRIEASCIRMDDGGLAEWHWWDGSVAQICYASLCCIARDMLDIDCS